MGVGGFRSAVTTPPPFPPNRKRVLYLQEPALKCAALRRLWVDAEIQEVVDWLLFDLNLFLFPVVSWCCKQDCRAKTWFRLPGRGPNELSRIAGSAARTRVRGACAEEERLRDRNGNKEICQASHIGHKMVLAMQQSRPNLSTSNKQRHL